MNFQISPGNLVTPAIFWVNNHFHPFLQSVAAVVQAVVGFVQFCLLYFPAYIVIGVAVVLSFWLLNYRLSLLCFFALGFCLIMDFWAASMATLALVVVSVFISVLIAVPLGILTSRHACLEASIKPLLDIMQTVPPWVYLIPAVIIFSLGEVPAVMATVIYGIPPMLRLTILGFKQVPKDLLELGQALGAPPSAILFKIEIPSAMPTLLVGLNQCIMLSLAMVVLAGLVGAGGLGELVTEGLTRMEMGLGLRAGLGIVALAILLDRLTRAALQSKNKVLESH